MTITKELVLSTHNHMKTKKERNDFMNRLGKYFNLLMVIVKSILGCEDND